MLTPRVRYAGALTGLVAGVIALGMPVSAGAAARASGPTRTVSQAGTFATTLDYVVRFYPRWFTYQQSGNGNRLNGLVGPDRISPLYHAVVAINDDTLYASLFMDLTAQPIILTIPATSATYSLLTLDAYGDIFQTNIPAATPGAYALIGPGWTGTLPAGVTAVPVPVNFSNWIIRADKFQGTVDTTSIAQQFRASILAQPLSDYVAHPSFGATHVVPEIAFATPFKQIADTEATRVPIEFLRELQTAMHDPRTPPLSAADQQLSDRFDALFGEGSGLKPSARAKFARGVRIAHARILANYHAHTIGHHWINFTNIGDWGTNYLDRDSITEYCQYCNNHSTAAYFHAFKDGNGAPLTGASKGYVLKFAADQIPAAKRFWSLTAYLPRSIELVPNAARKYVVASYTPGLTKASDGSISIYLARKRPSGVPAANWLPIPRGRFNVMLRDYGPEGSVADGSYVPPPIKKSR